MFHIDTASRAYNPRQEQINAAKKKITPLPNEYYNIPLTVKVLVYNFKCSNFN